MRSLGAREVLPATRHHEGRRCEPRGRANAPALGSRFARPRRGLWTDPGNVKSAARCQFGACGTMRSIDARLRNERPACLDLDGGRAVTLSVPADWGLPGWSAESFKRFNDARRHLHEVMQRADEFLPGKGAI